MEKFKRIFKDIEDISKVPFKIKGREGVIYTSSNLKIKNTFAESDIYILGEEYKLIVNISDKSSLPLLGNYLISKIRDEAERESNIIKKIIDNVDYSKKEVEKLYPFLKSDFILICINMRNGLKESIDMVKNCYDQEKVCIVDYKNNILIIGQLEQPSEHAQSIRETLEYNTKEKCIISYTSVDGYLNLSKAVKRSLLKIVLAKKYNIENEILSDNSLIFEEIVDSIDKDKAKNLVQNYENGFDKLDKEMVKSIDIFLKNNLNISESAKSLFIHRNTLIYRIEKVEKYTGFDIKKFNEALLFKILYSLWKNNI